MHSYIAVIFGGEANEIYTRSEQFQADDPPHAWEQALDSTKDITDETVVCVFLNTGYYHINENFPEV